MSDGGGDEERTQDRNGPFGGALNPFYRPADQAADLFVKSLGEREAVAARRLQEEIRTLHWQEVALFLVSIVAALTSVTLVVVGVILVFQGSLDSAGLATGMAVVSGAGTAGLRSMTAELRDRRDQLEDREQDSAQTLRAVGAALMIPDGDRRDSALAELASHMAKRVATQRSRGGRRRIGREPAK